MHRDNLAFAAACLGMLLFGIVFVSLGSVNNMLTERFQLDDVEIGTLTALLPLGILLGSLVFGPVVDSFGYRWMLVVAALIVGAGLEGLALTTSQSFVQGCVFAIGFGGGVLNGATNALAADVSEGRRAARLSLLGVFFGLGAVAMPGTLAVLSRSFSSTVIVATIGSLVLIPAAYCLVVPLPPPKQRNASAGLAGGIALLRDPVFLFAGLALAVQSGMEGMSNDWMTRYFKMVTFAGRQHQEWQLQLGLVAVTGAMMIARLALAGMLQRVSSQTILVASLAATAIGAMLLRLQPSYGIALLAAFLIGGGLAAVFPIVLSYIGDLYPDRSGTAFSTIFVIALLGNMTINKSFGYVAQAHGIEQYATVMLGCLAASAVLLALVVKQLKRNF